ncbi:M20/M25/M40 family metallo-hydrolase [Paraconexibacter antarcticus]|uniref:M20/M25/M40 family metallo-hydrolase n=1 Tax=Paraconexibacter antarcticus TaxID=2949664 RepID=A0ABY5DW08_9ACTN|nr:M20/M25/M40 family metallo-hydrolase [Paraconexibacter antarcticus]UTI65846.1 M20/M25/M40 family metallo-hydrolase [Paraconexibacter antarcticus]
MDEGLLAQRLMTYDTSKPDQLQAAAAFLKGWLESRNLAFEERSHNGLPVIVASAGAAAGPGIPTVVLHGHLDVVPAFAHQFTPKVEGDRLIGRGAYDMKGALAAMMCTLEDVSAQDRVRILFYCVPDEESEDVEDRSTDALVAEGIPADFAITGEPTDLHIGVQAKGVLAIRVEVSGTACHGSTPWQGDNAILKAHDVFRRIETLPFSRMSSDLFDRPSINLARIEGGDAFNKVPDRCWMDVDIRFLPGQDTGEILAQIRSIADTAILKCFTRAPAIVSRTNPYVLALRDGISRSIEGDALSVGRDGASDAISFLEAGIPAVEFGPVGAGHHGPEEWVSLTSLARYRQALGDFVHALPSWLEKLDPAAGPDLRSVEGGLA